MFSKTTAAWATLPAVNVPPAGSPRRNFLRGRRRRIIWNNDGTDLEAVAHSDLKKNPNWPRRYRSVDEFLKRRMKGRLEGSLVDSLFYNGHTDCPNWEFPSKNLRALGADPLKHVVDFAHENEMEFVYSVRMNEIHCAVLPGVTGWSPFKRRNLNLLQGNVTPEWFEQRVMPWARGEVLEHPLSELLQRSGGAGRDFYSWAAYDYSRPEVRDYFVGLVEEACRRYDLDGIELDWGRFPYLFRFGEERRNLPIMTDFVREIRRLLNVYGQQRGRAILLAIRVPDSPALALSVGLDAEAWIGEGWVDVLVAGFGFAPFTFPLETWVQLGHRHGIPVYGCIDHLVRATNSVEAMRGAAYRYWEKGADGIYLYNFFDDPLFSASPEEVERLDKGLSEIGDPGRLQRLDKVYQIDPDAQAVTVAEFGSRWQGWGGFHVGSWPGQLPLAFAMRSGAAAARLTLEIADDAEAASGVTLETQWKPPVDPQRAAWKVNGQPVPALTPLSPRKEEGEGWCQLDARPIRRGPNTFEVTVQPPAGKDEEPLVLRQLRVSISYA